MLQGREVFVLLEAGEDKENGLLDWHLPVRKAPEDNQKADSENIERFQKHKVSPW